MFLNSSFDILRFGSEQVSNLAVSARSFEQRQYVFSTSDGAFPDGSLTRPSTKVWATSAQRTLTVTVIVFILCSARWPDANL